jgi:hypothetical protein
MSWKEDGGASKLERFRALVQKQFGQNLEKATPANVREFMLLCQQSLLGASSPERLELNESKTTYEEILKDFFVRVLEKPTEEALITLWLMAFELSFYQIEQHTSERLQALFGDVEESF